MGQWDIAIRRRRERYELGTSRGPSGVEITRAEVTAVRVERKRRV
jgi:hypothetical protein